MTMLVQGNGVVDAWLELYGKKPGFTLGGGSDGSKPFPPNRPDKVAVLGLILPNDIEAVHPKAVLYRWT
ncbi:hypothetical protein F5X96DRAFT_613024 [Biscogniauxia mediterranea]|nr:hypothetical protein F5X96DRAFT_613024 [Biscogniauxia mediterranea]